MPDGSEDSLNNAVSVRPYRPADRSRCAEIYVAARRVAFAWVAPEQFTLDDFARDTADEEIAVAQAPTEEQPRILGFVSAYLPGRFVHHLYVDPDCRRMGVGRALIGHALALRPGPWHLKCVEANAPAMAFYRSQGWVAEGRGTDELGPYVTLRRD